MNGSPPPSTDTQMAPEQDGPTDSESVPLVILEFYLMVV